VCTKNFCWSHPNILNFDKMTIFPKITFIKKKSRVLFYLGFVLIPPYLKTWPFISRYLIASYLKTYQCVRKIKCIKITSIPSKYIFTQVQGHTKFIDITEHHKFNIFLFRCDLIVSNFFPQLPITKNGKVLQE